MYGVQCTTTGNKTEIQYIIFVHGIARDLHADVNWTLGLIFIMTALTPRV